MDMLRNAPGNEPGAAQHVIVSNYCKSSLCLEKYVFSKVYSIIIFKANAVETRFFWGGVLHLIGNFYKYCSVTF